MSEITYGILGQINPTSGTATTLATVPADHEYIGTVDICLVTTAATATSEYSLMALSTAGTATTKNYLASNVEIEKGDTHHRTVALGAGNVLQVETIYTNLAFTWIGQDKDNS